MQGPTSAGRAAASRQGPHARSGEPTHFLDAYARVMMFLDELPGSFNETVVQGFEFYCNIAVAGPLR